VEVQPAPDEVKEIDYAFDAVRPFLKV
jgi:hypothetical protein